MTTLDGVGQSRRWAARDKAHTRCVSYNETCLWRHCEVHNCILFFSTPCIHCKSSVLHNCNYYKHGICLLPYQRACVPQHRKLLDGLCTSLLSFKLNIDKDGWSREWENYRSASRCPREVLLVHWFGMEFKHLFSLPNLIHFWKSPLHLSNLN